MLRVQRALIRHATSQGRRWLAFSDPVEQFVADDLDAVEPALAAAEAAAQRGLWVAGFVSYDAGPAFDDAIRSHRDPATPLVAMAAFREARPSRGPAGRVFTTGEWTASDTQQAFESAVREIREQIAAGETYQVNYTMRLVAQFDGDPEGLFAALCRAQRADHLAFVDLGDAAVCSASPELFIRRQGRRLETRPMKGTRPRHPDPTVDRDLAEELISSEKDRAENTMIVDMARNDLGRVADVGSVDTTALHTIESYPTVHQLTSTVVADTDASIAEIFAATFPGASITGAPKIATSRLITELETSPRGIYTGAVGLIEPGGDAEFNIAIRTAWVDRRTGLATYGVGGGIVWDSNETAEWEEAHDKARVLHRATRPFRLLETLGWDPGAGPILLDRHLHRLGESAAHFGFDCDIEEVRRRLGCTASASRPRTSASTATSRRSDADSAPSEPTPHAVFGCSSPPTAPSRSRYSTHPCRETTPGFWRSTPSPWRATTSSSVTRRPAAIATTRLAPVSPTPTTSSCGTNEERSPRRPSPTSSSRPTGKHSRPRHRVGSYQGRCGPNSWPTAESARPS
jgi:para-aminobenzoate synthetase/4-amino-4-deoxychorismate lyase